MLRALAVAMVLATVPVGVPAQSASEGELTERQERTRLELSTLEDEITLSAVRKQQLGSEITALEADRAAINRSLIDTSTRSRSLEERIERSARRLEELRGEEDDIRRSLNKRRGLLIEVIAALQRMGHRPPPALLVTPEDALSSVRSAILLGAVVPEVRAETEILATELRELVRVRIDIDGKRQELVADLERLAEEEERLGLLLDQKKQLSNAARAELAEQTARAAELAGQANNLSALVDQLENEISAVREAAEAAKRAEAERRKREEQRIAEAREEEKPDFSDAARIAPAMAFIKAKGLLPKPVAGVELAAFDQRMRDGETSQGLSIATRAGNRVVSPSDGWVMYAGPFRSYGQLLIINAGDGYHVVLAGMEAINVELGQFVLAGEPVAVMGERRFASNASGSNVNVDVGSLRPVLYVEFRKDGNSIDPSPWWAQSKLEESNG
jgi:septal ring factor EnvC (AmiA/AmiB activator)